MTARNIACALLIVVIVGSGYQSAFAGGKLQKIEEELKKKKKKKKRSSTGTKKSKKGKKARDNSLEQFILECTILGLYWLFTPQYYFEYSEYPYEHEYGYPVFHPDSPFNSLDFETCRPFAFEAALAYHVDFEGVHCGRFYAKARLSCFFNIDFDAHHYFEPKDYSQGGQLNFVKIDALFNVFNRPTLDFDIGFGYSYIEGLGYYHGGNAKFTCDIFPRKPIGIHFSGCANWFEGGTLYETEAKIGLFWQRYEVRAGYRAIWIESVRIHGPILELAVWF
jgi:hypothetical protein